MKTLVLLLFLFGIVSAGEIKTDGTSFIFRAPQKVSSNSRIMILFGGRNWAGEKTLNTYHFDELADKHSLFLLSPSFRDRSYWEPEAWSGEALLKAIAELEKLYQLTTQKIYLYGYSAAKARSEVEEGYELSGKNKKIASAEEKTGLSVAEYLAYKLLEEDADTDGSGTLNQKEKSAALQEFALQNGASLSDVAFLWQMETDGVSRNNPWAAYLDPKYYKHSGKEKKTWDR